MLATIREQIPDEDFRRWFGATTYASDSGDQITVWVPTEGIRRHLEQQFGGLIDRACTAAGRSDVTVRFVVAGVDDDDTPAIDRRLSAVEIVDAVLRDRRPVAASLSSAA